MKALRPIAMLLLAVTIAPASVFAAEVAELRNGFTIPHLSREVRNGSVRLYLDESGKSFVDVPADQIQGYSYQPDVSVPSTSEPPASAESPSQAAAALAASPKSTDQIVREASVAQGVDSDFLQSVIGQESAGNPRAVSPAGARGLMQLMPATAQKLGVKDSFSPEQNVGGGALYLRELLERYHGDAIKALAAYNAGPGAVDRYHGVPPYRETQLYVRRIVRDYNRKKQSGESSAQKQSAHNRSAQKSSERRRSGERSSQERAAAVGSSGGIAGDRSTLASQSIDPPSLNSPE